MPDNLKIVDGKVVTDTEITLPVGWTNDYETIGGDMVWGKDGEVGTIVKECGLGGQVKPLFAMEAWTGGTMALFELDGQYFFHNPIDMSLHQIIAPSDLQAIASTIDDEDKGMTALETEQIC